MSLLLDIQELLASSREESNSREAELSISQQGALRLAGEKLQLQNSLAQAEKELEDARNLAQVPILPNI